MAKQSINIGSAANDGTGDPLRTAFDKINDNFTEVYDNLGGSSLSSITFSGSTITNTVTNGDITIDPNGTGTVFINGPLEVRGSATEINTTSLQIEDNLLELNRNSSGGDVDAGIFVNRGNALNSAFFYWNEGEDKWKAVLSTSDDSVTSAVTDTSTATIVANLDTQTITSIDGQSVVVDDSMQIRGSLHIDNNDSSSRSLFVEGSIDATDGVYASFVTASNLNGFISSTYNAQTNIDKIGSGTVKFNTNAEVKDSGNDVVVNNLTTNGNIVLQPQGTGGIILNGPISSSDSTEIVINDIVKIEETLIVNQIGTEDSSVVQVQDPLQVTGSVTASGGKVAGQFFDNDSSTITASGGSDAIDITSGLVKINTSGGTSTLSIADGADGQVIHIIMVVAGSAATLDNTNGNWTTSIVWDAVGEGATLVFDDTTGKWTIVGSNGVTIS